MGMASSSVPVSPVGNTIEVAIQRAGDREYDLISTRKWLAYTLGAVWNGVRGKQNSGKKEISCMLPPLLGEDPAMWLPQINISEAFTLP